MITKLTKKAQSFCWNHAGFRYTGQPLNQRFQLISDNRDGPAFVELRLNIDILNVAMASSPFSTPLRAQASHTSRSGLTGDEVRQIVKEETESFSAHVSNLIIHTVNRAKEDIIVSPCLPFCSTPFDRRAQRVIVAQKKHGRLQWEKIAM